MNPDIEQILLAQASREAEQGPRLSDAVALGGAGGAALGAFLGAGVRGINQLPGKIMGLEPKAQPFGSRLKPGGRMAGGLVGLALGGGLGAAIQQQAAKETGQAGAILAKIQAQGGMTLDDQIRLEAVLKDAYSQQGLLG